MVWPMACSIVNKAEADPAVLRISRLVISTPSKSSLDRQRIAQPARQQADGARRQDVRHFLAVYIFADGLSHGVHRIDYRDLAAAWSQHQVSQIIRPQHAGKSDL